MTQIFCFIWYSAPWNFSLSLRSMCYLPMKSHIKLLKNYCFPYPFLNANEIVFLFSTKLKFIALGICEVIFYFLENRLILYNMHKSSQIPNAMDLNLVGSSSSMEWACILRKISLFSTTWRITLQMPNAMDKGSSIKYVRSTYPVFDPSPSLVRTHTRWPTPLPLNLRTYFCRKISVLEPKKVVFSNLNDMIKAYMYQKFQVLMLITSA